ncbi:MAG: class I SAM-dependent methyltransferase [Deltaproteobacteria bacterium]|jgi:SAM-dependent methyltransferase|nr:class I SAM-dependent methyltransferase [Deltaproteobacteria bacterium]
MRRNIKNAVKAVLPPFLYAVLRRMTTGFSGQSEDRNGLTVQEYWTGHNVTNHRVFASAEESLENFYWRSEQYINYLNLMPVTGYDGKIVLDFGCGPGHDLVGFGFFSKPARLIGYDVSASSLAEAGQRLKLHGIEAQLIAGGGGADIPLDDAAVDVIHSSGVLHHVEDLPAILREFRRILKPGGEMRIMVYNYDSIFVHLYVPYILQIEQGLHAGLNLDDAFSRCTDGEFCPVSIAYRPEAFIALAREHGFAGGFSGAAVSMLEARLCAKRFDAIAEQRLEREHRLFLLDLTFDERGLPLYNGAYAGLDGCYRFVRE